jgi:indole-3-glycerol phosphate synthase
MASILDQIFAAKRVELAEQRERLSLDTIKTAALRAPLPRDFIAALRRHKPAIIAEVKRASPSKGDILAGLDPAAVARDYQAGGAAAISVLTDRHFKGSLADLSAVRAAVNLPILRKDFIFDPYQLYETRAAGADCVLLITAMLQSDQLQGLAALACELGLAALVEVHNREEFSRADELGAELIGINNRDLHTFRTDLATTSELLRGYQGGALIVSESGIETPEHIRQLYAGGARAFLIGESLLRGGTPRAALMALMNCFEENAPPPSSQSCPKSPSPISACPSPAEPALTRRVSRSPERSRGGSGAGKPQP